MSLYSQALDLAGALRRAANAADEAFLKREDPRAIQGGAICQEASTMRQLAREVTQIALKMEDLE